MNYFDTYEIENLKELLNKTTQRNKNRTAFKLKDDKGKIMNKTYSELKNDVQNLATKLIELGLKDKRVAIMGKNSYEWAISYLAVVIIGIVVPIDKEASSDNVKEFLNVSESEAIIADSKYLDEIFKFKDDLKNKTLLIDMQNTSKYTNIQNLMNDGKKLIQNGDKNFEDIKINPNEMKILLFTSGTTRKFKSSYVVT